MTTGTSPEFKLQTATDEIIGFIDSSLRRIREGVENALQNEALTPVDKLLIGQELILRSVDTLKRLGHQAINSGTEKLTLQESANEVEAVVIGQLTFRGQEVIATERDGQIFINGVPTQIKPHAAVIVRQFFAVPGEIRRYNAFLDTTDYLAHLAYSTRSNRLRNDVQIIFTEVNGIVPDLICFPKMGQLLVGEQTKQDKKYSRITRQRAKQTIEMSVTNAVLIAEIQHNEQVFQLKKSNNHLFVNDVYLNLPERATTLVEHLFAHPGKRLRRADMFTDYRTDEPSLFAKQQSFKLDMTKIITKLNDISPGLMSIIGRKAGTKYLFCPELYIPEPVPVKVVREPKPKPKPKPRRVITSVVSPRIVPQTTHQETHKKTDGDNLSRPALIPPIIEQNTSTEKEIELSELEKAMEELVKEHKTITINELAKMLSTDFPEIRPGAGGKIVIMHVIRHLNERYTSRRQPERFLIDPTDHNSPISVNPHYLGAQPARTRTTTIKPTTKPPIKVSTKIDNSLPVMEEIAPGIQLDQSSGSATLTSKGNLQGFSFSRKQVGVFRVLAENANKYLTVENILEHLRARKLTLTYSEVTRALEEIEDIITSGAFRKNTERLAKNHFGIFL